MLSMCHWEKKGGVEMKEKLVTFHSVLHCEQCKVHKASKPIYIL